MADPVQTVGDRHPPLADTLVGFFGPLVKTSCFTFLARDLPRG